MVDIELHLTVLNELNRNYVRSVDEADVAWFDANLAADFFNTNLDGTFVDRKAFLAQIGRGSTVRNIRGSRNWWRTRSMPAAGASRSKSRRAESR